MSPLWTASEIAAATGGTVHGDFDVAGATFDSREVGPGDLFIAMKGEVADGHAFIDKAIAAGAAGIICETAIDHPHVRVADSAAALKALGIASRARSHGRIIGVTGSAGKTGTKEALFAALDRFRPGKAHRSVKSYNNHVGVPLSLARMPERARFGVFEMGMNHANEITPLSGQVKPHVAIITTVAPTHIEFFADGLTGIARAKAEIFSGMDANGIAVLNRDIPQFDFIKAEANRQGVTKVFTFGEHQDADARLTDILIARNGTRIQAQILGEDITFTLKDAGKHNAVNALAVLLAIKLIGGDMHKAAQSLAKIEPPAGRGKREYLNIGDPENPVTLIDESYNASPVAMQAAFKVLALIDPGRGGRRIAILGDMLELGDAGAKLHADLALPLKAANVDLVYTSGTLMKHLYSNLDPQQQGAHTDTSIELASIVPDVLVPGDVVMVKGSLGSKMNVVVEALRALPSKRMASNLQGKA